MNNAQGMNPAALQALQAQAAARASASTPPKSRPETPRSRSPPNNDTSLPPHLAAQIQQQHKLATAAIAAQQAERKSPAKNPSPPPATQQSPSKTQLALGELGARLFPGANMSAKLNVNGK